MEINEENKLNLAKSDRGMEMKNASAPISSADIPYKWGSLFLVLTIVLFIALLSTIFCFLKLTTINDYMTTISRNYNAKISIIDSADDSKKVTGHVTDIKFDQSAEKWFFEYSIITNDSKTLIDKSLSGYNTRGEIERLHMVGQTVQVAVSETPITLETKTCPIDQKNIALTQEGNYIKEKAVKTEVYYIMFSSLFVAVVCGVLMFVFSKKSSHGHAKTIHTKQLVEFGPIIPLDAVKRHCLNCGAILHADDQQYCAKCGSKIGDDRKSRRNMQ